MKKLLVSLVVISILLLAMPAAVLAAETPCDLDLPEEVTVQFPRFPVAGDETYLPSLIVSGGTSLDDEYQGWCLDKRGGVWLGSYHAYVHNSCCDDLTGIIEIPANIDLVNWILNNYSVGMPVDDLGALTYGDIQAAIWHLLNSGPATGTLLGAYSQARIDAILAAAAQHEGFVPDCGQYVLIILKPYVWFTDDDYVERDDYQPLGILVPLVCEDYEGLTPGFWKNHTKVWEGYVKTDLVGDVFTIPAAFNELADDTLLQALKYGGGGKSIGMARSLLRAGVAAVLNASHPYVNYPMTGAQIISQVNEALATLDKDIMEDLKDQLDACNNLGGGIDAHGNPL